MKGSKKEKEEESEDKKDQEIGDKGRQIELLEKSLEEEKKRAEDYLKRLKYLQADFENYRKRVERERSEIIKREKAQLITRILVVLDELELAVKNWREDENNEVLVEGVKMIFNKLNKLLCDEGLCEIEALGKSFDPELHEVLLTVQTDEHPNNSVIEEVRKGYMLDGRVVRPSIVKVAKKSVKIEANAEYNKDN